MNRAERLDRIHDTSIYKQRIPEILFTVEPVFQKQFQAQTQRIEQAMASDPLPSGLAFLHN